MPTVSKEAATQRAIWQQHVFAPTGSLLHGNEIWCTVDGMSVTCRRQ